LITNSELTGFSEAERAVIANIARYHRGSLPKERHPEFAALNNADRDTVCKLGGIVRLADALDRSHDSRIADLQCDVGLGRLDVQLACSLECDNELLEIERKRDLFEAAFQRTLTFTVQQRKLRRA
jgi:exopolyphosphatase / guanosine-5'-triphosphate,3'-diphosphate pyrophosphatase